MDKNIIKTNRLSIVLPTFREKENIFLIIEELIDLANSYELEILIVDDDSKDGTFELVKSISFQDPRIRIIRRVGRSGLASAIKEGLLNAQGDIVALMDADGQHLPKDLINAVNFLNEGDYDLVIGSRFLKSANIRGLSQRRTGGSSFANLLARTSLPKNYQHITDYMSGCFVVKVEPCLPIIYKVDVNGFKFLYEFLSISRGCFCVGEVPLSFQPRLHGKSKLEVSIVWDFLISLLHTLTCRILPRRAISFGIVGLSGVGVQLITTNIAMNLFSLGFSSSLPISVIIAATSNYLINNILTFRSRRLSGIPLLKGLFKFLIVASFPVIANIGLATAFYNTISNNTVLAQIAGISIVFIWNYVASSRFVWNSP
ncbi:MULTISPECIES: glycosyltransferase [Prochlorococcus]|uniref:glycosyltransferase n=1 Tax=Prochlorococcus TaxID=1218 RepID=UPI0005339970|nr:MULTISPECIES: glycosyltransferase family 2 protein [Prochlorococcus]KGG12069.1 putative glycosyl transferase [Prochlorococcus sp. MIT 0601]